MRPRIALVDYGAGNIRSVAKALERSDLDPVVTSDPAVVRGADGVLLPGVGAFRDAVNALEEAGLADAIREVTTHGRPYLGICFGLQLLFGEGTEHGSTPGLGQLRGRVTRFPDKDTDGQPLLVPHIGWNEVRFEGDHPMIEALPERDVYYFVHSYRPEPTDPEIIVGRADYGGTFCAAIAKDNVFAIQFHPEKSQSAGKRLLDAYRAWLEAGR
ncbi:MAG: imidazole glycerol phosphate synthase subunit HisH [Deltaproteobacteria bacterium]|nr:imidazole glycerol phosphate synthase subunit HisH [Deltaproteobacteria bacterium]